uniref:Protein kinase domain-containing protein n=1 Tax=Meloidogyne incognita TaxID=6306 RepID=A0A914KR36_MELIC
MEETSKIYGDYKDPRGVGVTLRVKDNKLHTRDGNFSFVYRAKISQIFEDGSEQQPSQLVALKRTLVPRVRDFRELHILRCLSVRHPHPNIVKLMYFQRRKYSSDQAYSLVFEFVPATLAQLRTEYHKNKNVLDIKLCIWQLFAGLDHLRKLHIIHRDIKPANLLVNSTTGRLTIADFGSAIYLAPYADRFQGTYAVTRFYRPPEFILGAARYNCMSDVWSGGCIFAELYVGEALFQGNDAFGQLQLIYTTLGTPSINDLKDMHVRERDFIPALVSQAVYPFRELFLIFEKLKYPADKNPASLIVKILDLNPKKRLNGRRLLFDEFFDELFQPGKRRKGGGLVTDAISLEEQKLVFGTEV